MRLQVHFFKKPISHRTLVLDPIGQGCDTIASIGGSPYARSCQSSA
jgi:hypothetical protein